MNKIRRSRSANSVVNNCKLSKPRKVYVGETGSTHDRCPAGGQPVNLGEPLADSRDRSHHSGDFAVHIYMKEIGEVPLLTIEEEVELALRIQAGDEVARDRMIRANLRLVVKIAREYQQFGLPLLDLVSEGNIGLMKAVGKFDPEKGAKFSTYSSWWIKQAMRRALANQGKTIRLPSHVVEKQSHLRKASHRMHELLGREPTRGELAEELGYSERRVALLQRSAIRPASLDSNVGEDEQGSLGDLIADERVAHPSQRLDEEMDRGTLREVIEQLNPREKRILQHRFGLNGEIEQTLEEVGRKLGVTRERVRQLQNGALLKLRHLMESHEMSGIAA